MASNDLEQPVVTLLHQVEDVQNDNVDAIVRLPGGEVRTVTFFTLENIASLMRKYESTGECLSGKFFWAIDMVVVKDLRIETIEAAVLEMVRSGEYAMAFGTADEE